MTSQQISVMTFVLLIVIASGVVGLLIAAVQISNRTSYSKVGRDGYVKELIESLQLVGEELRILLPTSQAKTVGLAKLSQAQYWLDRASDENYHPSIIAPAEQPPPTEQLR